MSEHSSSIQSRLYCTTCWVGAAGQALLNKSECQSTSGELCDIFFQTKGRTIGIGATVSVNSWREVNLSSVRPTSRKVILCSKWALLSNCLDPLLEPPPTPLPSTLTVPASFEAKPFVEAPNVPFKRMTSQMSTSLALQCKKIESSDDSLCGIIEKVLFTNNTAFLYLLSLNEGIWELVLEGSSVFTEYKDLLYMSAGQTWSFCNLENVGTRKVRNDERLIADRWKPGRDTIFVRKCISGTFTGVPVAPGSMLLAVSANFRGGAPDLMPLYSPPPLFTVFEARDYLYPPPPHHISADSLHGEYNNISSSSSNNNNNVSACRTKEEEEEKDEAAKRVSLIGYVYYMNKRKSEFWLSDVSSETGFLCFLRVALRGSLAKQKASCGIIRGSAVLLRDLVLSPGRGLAFADRLTQFEVFKKDVRINSLSGGVLFRPTSFSPQKLWAGKDTLLEEATLKACEIDSVMANGSSHVPTFSSVPSLLGEIGHGTPVVNKVIAFSGTVTSFTKEYTIGLCSVCGKKMQKYEMGEELIFTCEDCGSYNSVETRVVVFLISNSISLSLVGENAVTTFKAKCGVEGGNEWDDIIGESFRDLTCLFYRYKEDILKAELLVQ